MSSAKEVPSTLSPRLRARTAKVIKARLDTLLAEIEPERRTEADRREIEVLEWAIGLRKK